MSRAHYLCLFKGRDEYIVFHPSDLDVTRAAARFPQHAVGRIRIGRGYAYAVENAQVLWSFLRKEGHSMCRECSKASCDTAGFAVDGTPLEQPNLKSTTPCAQVVWDEAWVHSTGMSRYETIPEWERIWQRVAEEFKARARENSRPQIPNEVHEQVLGLAPPYSREDVMRAFKKAALATHPDRGGSTAAFCRATEARDALAPP